MSSDDCSRFRALLPARNDVDLRGEDRSALEAHLSACTACQEEEDLFRATADLLSSQAFLPRLGDDFFDLQRLAIYDRLVPVDAWSAPSWSLVMVFGAAGLCLAAGMPALMASAHEFVLTLSELSSTGWTGMDSIVPLYGVLVFLAATRVQPEPIEQEVGI